MPGAANRRRRRSMKTGKLRELTKEELDEQGTVARRELFNLRIRQGAGTVEQPVRLRSLRREIARIKTIQKERIKA